MVVTHTAEVWKGFHKLDDHYLYSCSFIYVG